MDRLAPGDSIISKSDGWRVFWNFVAVVAFGVPLWSPWFTQPPLHHLSVVHGNRIGTHSFQRVRFHRRDSSELSLRFYRVVVRL